MTYIYHKIFINALRQLCKNANFIRRGLLMYFQKGPFCQPIDATIRTDSCHDHDVG